MPHTEHVTILFTDLVSSTQLATSIAPEAADELRHRHFSGLREAIGTHGGAEVKNLGDGLMVAFPAASAALGCAIAMQQDVERANAGTHSPLGLRIGISAGEATREEDDYFGDPVVEAARLCAVAEGGQIVVSDLVRAAAGRRRDLEFRDLGELVLKGLPDPIVALEVPWEPRSADDDAPVPLPARLAVAPFTGVVGRGDETQVLEDAWKRVAAGNGRELVLIAGEPGMGKTTLAAQCARSVAQSGGWVLLGRASEDVAAPYGPFVEALGHLVAYVPGELLADHVAQHGAQLERITPALRARLVDQPPSASTGPDTERYLLFGAVVSLLDLAASAEPVLIVLDDLQWADTGSLQLLRHLMAADHAMRVLFVATYRDSELSASHPLTGTLAALRREHGVTRIDLKGLDDTGVIAFVEAAAGQQLDSTAVGLAHALSRETDGNPFFVGEVLRNLVETGAIYQDDTGTWLPAADLDAMILPDSVREVIGSRAARLGEIGRNVLSLAAVIGRDFDLGLLARVSDVGEDELLDLLEVATEAALVVEDPDVAGRFSFSHALVQHTLYSDLGATRRARAHRRVAETLEALYGTDSDDRIGELAFHWASATQPVDSDKAVSYARRAGERALEALAPDEAVRHFAQALRFLGQETAPDPTLRIDLLLGFGTAQRQSGVADYRETLLEAAHAARELEDCERLVTAALANNRGMFSTVGVVDEERVEVLEAALSATDERDNAARARLLARLCSELSWSPFERRLTLADEAKAMARRVGDAETLVEVFTDCAFALRVPSQLDAQMAEWLELRENVDPGVLDPASLYWLCEHSYVDAVRATRFDVAQSCLRTMTEVAQRVKQPTLVWNLTTIKASEAVRRGELDEADRLCETAYEIAQASGEPDAVDLYSAQLVNIRWQQGRSSELTELISSLIPAAPDALAPAYRAALALAYVDGGRDEEARTLIDEAVRVDLDRLHYDAVWLDFMMNCTWAVIFLGHSEMAERLLEMLEPFDGQIPYEGLDFYPPVATVLGGLATLLGRYADAEVWFSETAELCAANDMRGAAAANDLLWGEMLLARASAVRDGKDRETGLELIERARASAAHSGYGYLERRALELLEA
jgi:class 3 adenylate cyclase/tetratricopeptide (TPR) repeat protein